MKRLTRPRGAGYDARMHMDTRSQTTIRYAA